jgi:hypothetical protein
VIAAVGYNQVEQSNEGAGEEVTGARIDEVAEEDFAERPK